MTKRRLQNLGTDPVPFGWDQSPAMHSVLYAEQITLLEVRVML
jgi:hypothetical protein